MYRRVITAILIALIACAPTAAQKKRTTKAPKPAPKKSPPVTIAAIELLSVREKAIWDEINLARTKPGDYLKFLEEFRKNYRGNEIHFPDGRILVTNEGVKALDDAIRFVRGLKPVAPLVLRKGLVLAAKAHVNDMDRTGKSGHTGSDGSKPQDRLARFGTWNDSFGENIVYDSRAARADVIGMLIDDGVANRGHRKNVFKDDFTVMGVAVGQSSANRPTLAVLTFAESFVDKP